MTSQHKCLGAAVQQLDYYSQPILYRPSHCPFPISFSKHTHIGHNSITTLEQLQIHLVYKNPMLIKKDDKKSIKVSMMYSLVTYIRSKFSFYYMDTVNATVNVTLDHKYNSRYLEKTQFTIQRHLLRTSNKSNNLISHGINQTAFLLIFKHLATVISCLFAHCQGNYMIHFRAFAHMFHVLTLLRVCRLMFENFFGYLSLWSFRLLVYENRRDCLHWSFFLLQYSVIS